MKKHFTKFLAVLIAVLVVAALLPMQAAMAEDSSVSCSHPSEFVTVGWVPSGAGTHKQVGTCSKCGTSFETGSTGTCSDSDGNGSCDVCGQTMPTSGTGGTGGSTSTCTHPNIKESEISPGSSGFPYGGKILYCPDCGFSKDLPNAAPADSAPPAPPEETPYHDPNDNPAAWKALHQPSPSPAADPTADPTAGDSTDPLDEYAEQFSDVSELLNQEPEQTAPPVTQEAVAEVEPSAAPSSNEQTFVTSSGKKYTIRQVVEEDQEKNACSSCC